MGGMCGGNRKIDNESSFIKETDINKLVINVLYF